MGSSTSKSKEPKTPKCSPTLKVGQSAKDTKQKLEMLQIKLNQHDQHKQYHKKTTSQHYQMQSASNSSTNKKYDAKISQTATNNEGRYQQVWPTNNKKILELVK